MEIHFSDGTVEQYQDTPLKAGAQGTIYVSQDKQSVVKIYHKDPAHPTIEREHQERIDKLIDRFNPTKQDPFWKQLYTWPEKRVIAPGVGYRMRFVTGMKTLDHYIFPKTFNRLPPEEKGWFIGRIAAAIQLVTAADRMARMGLCYPDFAPKNLLVDPFAGTMVLIDCDSLTVPTFLPPTIAGTSWFRAPELIAHPATPPSVETDRHAMAVLLYYRFLFRHPLNGDRPALDADPDVDDQLRYGVKALYTENKRDFTNRLKDHTLLTSEALGPELQRLFEHAFVTGLHQPAQRPMPFQWLEGLQRTYDRLIPCASAQCEWHAFVYPPIGRLICPKCKTLMSNPRSIPLLYLHQQKMSSKTSTTNTTVTRKDTHYMVGWPQRALHQWHTRTDATPFYADLQHLPNTTPCAVFAYDQVSDQWYLQNLSLPELHYRPANMAAQHWLSWPIKSAVRLEQGMEILFSKSSTSFLATIVLRQTP